MERTIIPAFHTAIRAESNHRKELRGICDQLSHQDHSDQMDPCNLRALPLPCHILASNSFGTGILSECQWHLHAAQLINKVVIYLLKITFWETNEKPFY